MRYLPWSSLKLFKYMREKAGIKDIQAASIRGWEIWEQESREKARFIFWITYTLPDKLQTIIEYPAEQYHSLRCYIKNRFFDKLHYLHTGLKPGEYCDLDTRILHGLFQSLVDYVEIEKAHLNTMTSFKRPKRWLRFFSIRNKDAGLEYLTWETSLKEHGTQTPSEQAKLSIETLALYHWWTKQRPGRQEPEDISGLSTWRSEYGSPAAFHDAMHNDKNLRVRYHQYLDECARIEQQYEKEDEEMCIRLIKIRRGLWT